MLIPIANLNRADLESGQLRALQKLLQQQSSENAFYSKKFRDLAPSALSPRSLADLELLPFTTKAELVANQAAFPPYGTNLRRRQFMGDYQRFHQTSGTTGAPLRWLDTAANWQWMLECWQQLFAIMQLRRDDRLLFAFSFGPFLGFWAGFEGAQKHGNFCVTAGGLATAARLNLIFEHGITVVCCTPTYALRMAEVADELSLDLRGSSVRALLVAGEPGGNVPATRARIEERWNAQVIDHWGMTELGPLAIENGQEPGSLLVLETACIAEVINPNTLERTATNEPGELVITNLGRVDSPLIRYRTGDRVLPRWPKPDDRGWPLLCLQGGIQGRVDDMLTIRGNNVYPSAIEDVVRGFPEIVEFQITLRERSAMQELQVRIEPAATADDSDGLCRRVATALQLRFNLSSSVTIAAAGSLPRYEMKSRRFRRE